MTPPPSPASMPVAMWDVARGAPVDAELWDRITQKNLDDWEHLWIPALRERLHTVGALGRGMPHRSQAAGWHWRDKLEALREQLAHKSYALVCDNQTQAMMIVDHTHRARLSQQHNQHLIYISYIESAPWNRADFGPNGQQLAGCGSLLVGAAIKLSIEEGFKGRVGLHSLPQSNDFYANQCGMQDLGQEPAHQNLRYFEATPQIAQQFLGKGTTR